jgi:hypothetical protein
VVSVTCDFIDAAFIMLWGGVIGLLFHELFYLVCDSERYSYVGVFK